MGFYEEISKYYDYIFPVKDKQLHFIKETTGTPPKNILDIACGNGGYSVELAKQGYSVTATDLDKQMIEETKKKAAEHMVDLNVLQSDMLSLNDELNKRYHTIFCIGNSVAHLSSEQQIAHFFKSIARLLLSGGNIVVQIINYDRILEHGINELPTISNEQNTLTFHRKYKLDSVENKILFITKLIADGNEYNNSIPLVPITSERFISLIADAGFDQIETYGDFNQTPYDRLTSYHLVIRAKI